MVGTWNHVQGNMTHISCTADWSVRAKNTLRGVVGNWTTCKNDGLISFLGGKESFETYKSIQLNHLHPDEGFRRDQPMKRL